MFEHCCRNIISNQIAAVVGEHLGKAFTGLRLIGGWSLQKEQPLSIHPEANGSAIFEVAGEPAGGCNSSEIGLEASLRGPALIAGHVVAQPNSCNWTISFEVFEPGEYELSVQVHWHQPRIAAVQPHSPARSVC